MNHGLGSAQKVPGLISVSIVSRYRQYLYPFSQRSVERMCQDGVFKTAVKLGPGKRSRWWVEAWEVLDYKARRHATQIEQE